MRRREFIAGLGSATAWPLAVRAQQSDRPRRLGVLSPNEESDSGMKAYVAGFTQALAELGWTDGRNLRIDMRWAGGGVDRIRMFAKELIGLQPDVILSISTPVTAVLLRETRTIPIVFTAVSNPVGDGFVASLTRPGGNVTGFMIQEATIAGKWLELLTQIAPRITRAAAMFNPDTSPDGGAFFVTEFEAAARLLKVATIAAPVSSDADIEAVIAGLGREPDGGLVVTPDVFTVNHRASIISLASQYNVPAVYRDSVNVREGALLSYGPYLSDTYRLPAPYVDRVLRGAKPAELPVQLPVKFEMALNTKTATALGLTVPTGLIALADEVIE
jgi:putative tryptophan/tyrosine transport system substrate-binding protein